MTAVDVDLGRRTRTSARTGRGRARPGGSARRRRAPRRGRAAGRGSSAASPRARARSCSRVRPGHLGGDDVAVGGLVDVDRRRPGVASWRAASSRSCQARRSRSGSHGMLARSYADPVGQACQRCQDCAGLGFPATIRRIWTRHNGFYTSDTTEEGHAGQDRARTCSASSSCSMSRRQPARLRAGEVPQHPQRRAVGPEAALGRHASSARRSTSARCSTSTRTATRSTSWTRARTSSCTSTREALGDSVNYLIPDAMIKVEFYGAEPVGIELPPTVDLMVEDTAPGHQGRDRQRPDQAGAPRDRPRRPGAAVRQHRRQGPRQHRDRRVPVASVERRHVSGSGE